MNSPSFKALGRWSTNRGSQRRTAWRTPRSATPAAELRRLATKDAGNLSWQLAAQIHTRSSESEGQPPLCPGFLAGPWQTHGPSRLLFGLYGIISRDGTL